VISRTIYLNELLHHYLSYDLEQGLEMWSNLFDRSLEVWDLSGCHQLLREIRRLDPSTEAGMVAFLLSKTSQGMLAAVTGDWEKAIRTYTSLLSIVPEENLGWVLSNLGNIYYLAKDFDNALRSYSGALQEYRKTNNTAGEAKVFVNLGGIYREMGNIQSSIQNSEAASQLIPEADIETRIINLSNWAGALQVSGNLSLATNKYQEALKLLEQYDALHLKAQVLGNLGILYIDQDNPADAIPYFLEDLSLHQQFEDIVGQAETLNNLGLAYNRTGETKKALHCYQQSAEIKSGLGDAKGELLSWSNYLIACMNHQPIPAGVLSRAKQLALGLQDEQTMNWLESLPIARGLNAD
jgi:tetratricopeptide (TPR) repeat protein